MKRRALFALILTAASPALAREIAGRTVPETVTISSRALVLNGAGIRSALGFKIYVGALYLPRRTDDPGEAVSMPGPQRLDLIFLRTVDKERGANA